MRQVQLVLIGPPDESDPELLELVSDSTAISATVLDRDPVEVNDMTARTIPARRVIYSIEVRVVPDQVPIGLFHEHLTAKTSTGEAKLHIHGEICRPILATPASLLVTKAVDADATYHIRLKNLAQDQVEILSAWCPTPGIECQIDNKRNEVAVRVAQGAVLDSLAAVEIRARAGDVDETLQVPLVGF